MRFTIEIDGNPINVEVLNDIRIMVSDPDFVLEDGRNEPLELTYKLNHEGLSIEVVNPESGEVIGDSCQSHLDYFDEHTAEINSNEMDEVQETPEVDPLDPEIFLSDYPELNDIKRLITIVAENLNAACKTIENGKTEVVYGDNFHAFIHRAAGFCDQLSKSDHDKIAKDANSEVSALKERLQYLCTLFREKRSLSLESIKNDVKYCQNLLALIRQSIQ